MCLGALRSILPSMRVRSVASIVLAVLGALVLLAGTVAFYVDQEVVDREAFADRALVALEDDGVRTVVRGQIVVGLIDRASGDLVAAQPLLESVVDVVIDSEPFRAIFRRAALEANRVFFVREKQNALVDISDAAKLVELGMRSVSPKVAAEIPEDFDSELAALRRRDFAGQSLAVAEDARRLGVVLPIVALVLLAGAVAVAPDRRIGVLRAGVAAGTAGAVLAIVLIVLRTRTLAGVYGEDELTDEEVRDAVRGLLDAFVGDLITWALLIALGGLVLAAAAAALDHEEVERPLARLKRRVAERPVSRWGQALRGAGALVAGALLVLNPALSLQIVAIFAGGVLIFFGASEMLALLHGPAPVRQDRPGRLRALAVAGIAGLVIAGTSAAFVLVTTDGAEKVQARAAGSSSDSCNGAVSMCDLPLNEAVFAGTHNSFSAADSPGWFITNQRRTIERQLADGIRLFLIDPHWGVQDDAGKVRTDFDAEARDRNRVAAAMPPEVRRAAQRLAGRLGAGRLDRGERDVWLCHNVCELGATRMVDALGEIRTFLDANPGEVVILFLEPYVPPEEVARTMRESGLIRYVRALHRDEPLPTLGQLVAEDRRVIVISEKDADGSIPWYMDGFSLVQDTPLGAQKVGQLSCARHRGTADSPILMLNQWADLVPPRRVANKPFLRRRLILDRARECERKRGLPVGLIAVDHYDQGELTAAVAELNAERVVRLRERQRNGGEAASG